MNKKTVVEKITDGICLTAIFIGVPYLIIAWTIGAIMCGGGNGPDTSYCM